MNTLHAPTVPSGPTTAARATNRNPAQLTIAELQRKKDDVEGELKALGGVLDSHGVDMNTNLLTPDGFPRADIDVAQIRTTRARIIHLRNDWKELMGIIETRLHEHFASLDDDNNTTPGQTNGTGASSVPRDSVLEIFDRPFAKINTVADNSPAAAAGLEPGDLVRNFGYVNFQNHDGLKKVAECVQGNEGQNILVKVLRSSGGSGPRELRLTLTPRRNWGGRGTLGCHILPL